MYLKVNSDQTKIFTDKPRNIPYERGYEEGYRWGKYSARKYPLSKEDAKKEVKYRDPKLLKNPWGFGFIDGALDGNYGKAQKYPKK